MMAPTERSMPAVITISVWAMPITPMIVTCWMISDRLKEERKREPTMRLKSRDAEQQHDRRHRSRIGMEKMLQPAQRGFGADLEFGHAVVFLSSSFLSDCGL